MVLVCALVGNPAAAAEPTVLVPSSQWILDYADNRCRLVRTFGAGTQKALLFFDQSAPGNRFGLSAAGADLKRFRAGRPTLVRINETVEARKTEPFNGTLDGFGPALIYSSLQFAYLIDGAEPDEDADTRPVAGFPAIDMVEATKAEFIEFGQSGYRVRFATGNLRAPMAALNTCSADLVRAWGLDLEKHRTMTRRPVWSNRPEVVRRIVARYPAQALFRGDQGIVNMRVMLDANGSVTDCQVERATSAESLVSPACREMQQARFEPALDSEGKAMKSFYGVTIVYKIAR